MADKSMKRCLSWLGEGEGYLSIYVSIYRHRYVEGGETERDTKQKETLDKADNRSTNKRKYSTAIASILLCFWTDQGVQGKESDPHTLPPAPDTKDRGRDLKGSPESA